jgi:hypothetical protein
MQVINTHHLATWIHPLIDKYACICNPTDSYAYFPHMVAFKCWSNTYNRCTNKLLEISRRNQHTPRIQEIVAKVLAHVLRLSHAIASCVNMHLNMYFWGIELACMQKSVCFALFVFLPCHHGTYSCYWWFCTVCAAHDRCCPSSYVCTYILCTCAYEHMRCLSIT